MDKNSFCYCGHSFIGSQQFKTGDDFKKIVDNLYSQVMNDDITDNPWKWNYENFYQQAKKAGQGNMDIFLMDNKYHVVPCKHFLAIYGKDDDVRYREICDIQKEMQCLSFKKGALMDSLNDLVLKCLKTKENHTWNTMDENVNLTTVVYCNGYIEVEIKRIYIQNNKLTLEDNISGETFDADDTAFTVDTLLDILNSFTLN